MKPSKVEFILRCDGSQGSVSCKDEAEAINYVNSFAKVVPNFDKSKVKLFRVEIYELNKTF